VNMDKGTKFGYAKSIPKSANKTEKLQPKMKLNCDTSKEK